MVTSDTSTVCSD